ncbi:peroxisomal carnitine O-octanoyltransferase [Hermetia illucens]|nr:peroxisomal carnitine O-octanoyltransferase [Hermetia illucens]
MLSRKDIYWAQEGEPKTFDCDEGLPPLPLPKLEDTLERYYETLKPFGTKEELANSRRIIDEFKNGIGKKLHQIIEDKTKKEKNWVEKWWEDYGYFFLRVPLYPYTVMVTALPLQCVGIQETPEYCLKGAARLIYHTMEFWDLMYHENLRQQSSPDGSIRYSMTLYRRFFCSSRLPGDPLDTVETHFKTLAEGGGPTHGLIIGKGRIFIFDCLDSNGNLQSPQSILQILQIIRGAIDSDKLGDCVPVLTCDDRTSWAKNRQRLQELSPHNKDLLKVVESSVVAIYLDEHLPGDYSESSQLTLAGDFHSKWGDRTSVMIVYPNGHIGFIGEHSAYDGTCSMNFMFFALLSLLECGEPDWSETPKTITVPIEQRFDLDDHLTHEIQRVLKDCDERSREVIVSCEVFTDFGRSAIKECQFHPDAFVQVVLQLAYYKMHGEIAPTYETALMRHYYNGRTETLRSCTVDAANFVKTATNPKSSKREIYEALKKAVKTHSDLMNEMRKGNGVDRHLFGMWCAAYERNWDIPELYSDPLYAKSGGGGNFVLSTSTLGFTVVAGFVAPMVTDGYGFFYSITTKQINLITTAYRTSQKTSAFKLSSMICETFKEMKAIADEVASAKL